MAQLSDKERIARVEQAPAEVQTRVAKAYLRDDIDDESVQYLFNTDSLEELMDTETIIENENAAAPEGIGANGFTMRTWKPSNNLNFTTVGAGGWNTCIKGYPMDPTANVLANCVGYASGRFNEIINIARDTAGCAYKTLNCNAENFVERAVAAGLQTGSTPRLGAIMCWQKGSLASSDGAGHVAIVERVNDNNSVFTSESCYNGTAFYNSTRTNNNGKWGAGSAYTFRCFIYLPEDVQRAIEWVEPTPTPDPEPTPITPNVDRDIYKDQLEVLVNDLRVRTGPGLNYGIIGIAHQGWYNYYEAFNADGYWWYRIADGQWVATYDGWTDVEPAQIPTPDPEPIPEPIFQVGDNVKIIGTGNGNSLGTGSTAYGIGWNRQILKIWEGRSYPYQVGNSISTTGFYREDALEKI